MTAPAAVARAAALSCEGKKDGLRQTQEGLWKVTFTVSPLDMPQSLMAARPGTRYMLALVEIGDDEQPVTSGPLGVKTTTGTPPEATQPPPQASGAGRGASQDNVVTRAAMLPGDPRFVRWIGAADHAEALTLLRARCGVASRRDLAIDNEARARFLALEDEYMVATGQRPWRRPDRRSA